MGTSDSNEVANFLNDLCDRETTRFHVQVPKISIKRCVVELVRNFDYYLEVCHHTVGNKLSNQMPGELIKLLFPKGLLKAIEYLWSPELLSPERLIYPSDVDASRWAKSALLHAGEIAFYRRIIQMLEYDLLEVSMFYKKRILLSHKYKYDLEKGDVITFDKSFRNDLNASHKFSKSQRIKEAKILKRMGRLVSFLPPCYLRFNTDEEIDALYLDKAKNFFSCCPEFFEFTEDIMFGGVPFQKYLNAVIISCSFAMKQHAFAVLLSNQNKAANPIDIIAQINYNDTNIAELAHMMKCDYSAAQQCFETMLLDETNLTLFSNIYNGPIPPYISWGNGLNIRSYHSSIATALPAMLRNLRYKYRSDWDRAVDGRESIYRKQLYAILRMKNNSLLELQRSLNITSNKGNTDIDALIIDVNNKTLGIFQIKWQDHFVGELKTRNTKKENFLVANQWIDKIYSWLDGEWQNSLVGCGFTRKELKEISNFKVFVLGRHYSNFTGVIGFDNRAAWGNWYQIKTLINSIIADDPVNSLYYALKKYQNSDKFLSEIKVAPIHINSLGIDMEIVPCK